MDFKTINDAVALCAKRILTHTVQLYQIKKGVDDFAPDELVEPEPVASGILVAIQGKSFLVTAAHVFEKNMNANVGIIIGEHIHILVGDLHWSDGQLDIDIAVLALESKTVEELAKIYVFLSVEKIGIDHVIQKKNKYLIIGFPYKATSVNKKEGKIKPKPFVLVTEEGSNNEYKRYGFDPLVHGIFKFSQKKVRKIGLSQRYIHKSPQGISGCGIWHIVQDPLDTSALDFYLTGMIIEQNDERTRLIATRVHILTEILRTDFYLNLPVSKIARRAR